MFCTKCGNPFTGESMFCTKCGAPRTAQAQQSEPVQQVSPPFPAQQAAPQQAAPQQFPTAPQQAGPQQYPTAPQQAPLQQYPPVQAQQAGPQQYPTAPQQAPLQQYPPAQAQPAGLQQYPPARAQQAPLSPPPVQAQQAGLQQYPPAQAQQTPFSPPPAQAQQSAVTPPVWQQPGGQAYNAQPPGGTQHSFYGTQPPASPPPKSGSNKMMKILLGVGIPVVAIAVALIVFFVVRPGRGDGISDIFGNLLRANPAAVPIADALDVMLDEFEQRVETTPLQAIPIMIDNFENGTLTVNFEYEDRSSWGLGNFSGEAVLRSDTRNNNYALEAAISAMGMLNIDLGVFLDSNRLAFGSSLIGDEFYGITFSTFSEDFRNVGSMFGLSQSEINEITDAIDLITEMMEGFSDFANNAAVFAPYLAVLTNFIRDMDYSSERVELNIGGQQVEATRISTNVTMREYIDLMEEFVNVMADDANIRDMFREMGSLTGDFGLVYGLVYDFDTVINVLRDGLRDIGREVEGSISESYYIGSNGRLLRITTTMDANNSEGEQVEIYAEMNFGTSADDKWTMEITTNDGWARTEMSIDWDIRETFGGYENTLSMSSSRSSDWWDSHDSVTFTSTWSPETGHFTLGFGDDWGFYSFDGIFNLLPQGFSLRFDDIEMGWDERLSIEIISDRGANIRNINYINISQWEDLSLDMFDDLFGGIFGDILGDFGMGGYIDPWAWDVPAPPPPAPVPAPLDPPHGSPTPPPPSTADLLGTWEATHSREVGLGQEEIPPGEIFIEFYDNGTGVMVESSQVDYFEWWISADFTLMINDEWGLTELYCYVIGTTLTLFSAEEGFELTFRRVG